MSQWNTLSIPLKTGWQCTLVVANQYRSQSGDGLLFMRDKSELRQIEEDRQDFARYFRPNSDLRTVSGRAELRTIQSFLSQFLNVVHWNLPGDNAGVERMLREAVADGRLVPVINRDWRSSGLASRPAPAPLRSPSGGGGFGSAGQKWSVFATGSSGLLSFNGEPVLSGPYDPATQATKLSAARDALDDTGSDEGSGLLQAAADVAVAAPGTDSGSDDSDDMSMLLGDAQPFEYRPDAVSGDVEELAASTNNPKFAAKMLGYDYKTFGTMLHKFKDANGLGPADNSIFHDNGDVEFNGRIFEDSIHDYAP
ncbi:MAG TPA: hypothetical protein VEN30_19340 [Paraburkholderia sp.]|nr:hypothetical protein [Paraburkholderia sp.]